MQGVITPLAWGRGEAALGNKEARPGWKDAEGLGSLLIGPPSHKSGRPPPGMWPVRVN